MKIKPESHNSQLIVCTCTFNQIVWSTLSLPWKVVNLPLRSSNEIGEIQALCIPTRTKVNASKARLAQTNVLSHTKI